jgi:hypothetical protein
MKFGVEVLVAIGPSTHVIKRHDSEGINHSLKIAQELAVAMFPEDPMAARTFRSGRFVYTNRNDLGDLVVIRPFMEHRDGSRTKPFVKEEKVNVHGFVFATDFPPEPA